MLQAMEVGILLTLSVTTVLILLPGRQHIRSSLVGALLASILLVLDWALGHGRWQMIFAALLCVVLVISAFGRYRGQYARPFLKGRRLRKAAFGVVLVFLFVGALLPPLLFPMFTVPAPSGPYGVGYMDVQLRDNTRPETMSLSQADRRELMVRVWYPSDVPEWQEPLPFLKQPEALQSAFSQLGSVADYVFSQLKDISSFSYAHTPLANGQGVFPILVFNHGMGMFGSANGLMLENLASHGYVVFSLEHTYHASLVKFLDGRRVPYKADWMKGELPASAKKMVSDMAKIQYAPDYDAYLGGVSNLLKAYPVLHEGVSLWVADVGFLLDHLATIGDKESSALGLFAGRLNFDKVGVFGMSFGGAASGMFCLTDDRCKVGINMDGLQLGQKGEIEQFSLEVPFMTMNSDRRIEYNSYLHGEQDWSRPPFFGLNDFVFFQSRSSAYAMTIADAAHNNFTDLAFISPLGTLMGLHGDIPPETMNKIMNDYTLAFFNRYLLNAPSPLLVGNTRGYPHVEDFRKRQGGSNP